MLLQCPACDAVTEIDDEESPRFPCGECGESLRVPGTPPRPRKSADPKVDHAARNIIGGLALFYAVVIAVGAWGVRRGWFDDGRPAAVVPNAPANPPGRNGPGENADEKEYRAVLANGRLINFSPLFFRNFRESTAEDPRVVLADFRAAGRDATGPFYTFTFKKSGGGAADAAGNYNVILKIDGALYQAVVSPPMLRGETTRMGFGTFFLRGPLDSASLWVEADADIIARVRGRKLSRPISPIP